MLSAINRERQAGVPINQIRINQNGKLRNAKNPQGLIITNTRDEPAGEPNYAKTGTAGLNEGLDGAIATRYLDYN